MDENVYRALRRKLAAAKAIGDLERINQIRAMMPVPEEAPPEVGLPLEIASERHAERIAEEIVQDAERRHDAWPKQVNQLRWPGDTSIDE